MGRNERNVRELLDLQPVIRPALIISRRRQNRWSEVVRKKNNDRKGTLDNPVDVKEPPKREEDKKTSQSQKSVARFFVHGKHLRPGRSPGNI